VDDNLNYYFLEMNTRLQVEHPITERVVGVDLVKQQINIANGLELPFKQEDLSQRGHAIEVRIYAEDPDNNFMPSPGVIKHITEPLGLGVRHDGYAYEGYEIPMYYDPMISKLIVWGENRSDAIARLKRALYAYKITGVKTSIPYLYRILEVPAFVEGRYNTHFIEENQQYLQPRQNCTDRCVEVAAITAFIDYVNKLDQLQPAQPEKHLGNSWKDFGRKRSVLRF
jgi:acetyl-CoA carboxylase biotin carboxylase subunit